MCFTKLATDGARNRTVVEDNRQASSRVAHFLLKIVINFYMWIVGHFGRIYIHALKYRYDAF